ncbi:methyltransferase domain-containing protein [Sulfurihydrogenibium sp.]|uniref:methyltransferase domain-containing protein n=1 Tax=Sulfurihydrogenibium sp. TaxID=2053621 RepID=UPI00261A6FD9|nr:methyltransferase domain-containing protein [Sulfurihydrogenibium sp.]
MSVSKDLIRISFSKAISSYDKEILIQRQTALELSHLEKDLKGHGVDLGCGTGMLTTILNQDVVGLDISFGMAKIYKKKNKNVVVGDIENIPFKSNTFDFGVSNFALHWTDVKKSFQEVSRILKPKGKFIFCMPVEGSLRIVEEILGEKNFDFYNPDFILNELSKYFSIEEYYMKSYSVDFNNGLELLKHLHLTGSSIGKKGKTVGEKRNIYNKFKNYTKKTTLNFEVIFVNAVNLRF